MSKRYVDMNPEECIDEWYHVDKKWSEIFYLAVGVMAGVLGNLAVNRFFGLMGISETSEAYTLIGSVALGIVGLFGFLTWKLWNETNKKKAYLNELIQKKRPYQPTQSPF